MVPFWVPLLAVSLVPTASAGNFLHSLDKLQKKIHQPKNVADTVKGNVGAVIGKVSNLDKNVIEEIEESTAVLAKEDMKAQIPKTNFKEEQVQQEEKERESRGPPQKTRTAIHEVFENMGAAFRRGARKVASSDMKRDVNKAVDAVKKAVETATNATKIEIDGALNKTGLHNEHSGMMADVSSALKKGVHDVAEGNVPRHVDSAINAVRHAIPSVFEHPDVISSTKELEGAIRANTDDIANAIDKSAEKIKAVGASSLSQGGFGKADESKDTISQESERSVGDLALGLGVDDVMVNMSAAVPLAAALGIMTLAVLGFLAYSRISMQARSPMLLSEALDTYSGATESGPVSVSAPQQEPFFTRF